MLFPKAQSIIQMWEIIGKKGIEASRKDNKIHSRCISELFPNPPRLHEWFLVFQMIWMFILLFQLWSAKIILQFYFSFSKQMCWEKMQSFWMIWRLNCIQNIGS